MVDSPAVSSNDSARRRLRVVTMVDRLMTSGGEIMATRIAMYLDRNRFDSILCSTRRSDPADVARAEAAGVRVISLDRRSRLDAFSWLPFIKLLVSERIDVLHAHKFGSNVWGAALGRAAGVAVVVAHEHTWSYIGRPGRRLLDRELIARGTDAFLSVSAEDRRRMIELERIQPTKLRYVANGIPPVEAGDGGKARRSLGLGGDVPIIGTICTLRPQKALDVFLKAIVALTSEFPNLRALVVGDGPERGSLEQLTDELGLRETVNFLGARGRHELPDLLAALDVAVLSSDYEGMPLTLLEFMGAGKAIVATRVGGVPTLIDDAVHGLLVAPREPHELADGVAKLLRDPNLRRELGENAAARQRREFDLGTMVGRLEILYESLYWSSPRGRREALASTTRTRSNV